MIFYYLIVSQFNHNNFSVQWDIFEVSFIKNLLNIVKCLSIYGKTCRLD